MFIAMNRFLVAKGSEAAFEHVWMSRDSHLDKVPGFVEFHLLKGSEAEDHTLYASHTVWENRAVFEAWTKSEGFRAAHGRVAADAPLKKQGLFGVRIKRPLHDRLSGRGTDRRGKACACQLPEALFGLQERVRVLRIEIVASIAGAIHHDF